MKTRKVSAWGAVVLSIMTCAACTKSDASGQSGTTTTTSVSTLASSDPTLDAINAKVPKELAGVLHFEAVTFRGDANGDGAVDLNERISAYKPAGWNSPQGFDDRFEAPKNDKADASFDEKYAPSSSLHIGTDCDGMCEPKDWKKVADKEMSDAFGKKAVTKDETLPHGGHIRWGTWQGDDSLHPTSFGAVVAAWPVAGANVMRSCSAMIYDPRLLPALDAFAEACKASQKF